MTKKAEALANKITGLTVSELVETQEILLKNGFVMQVTIVPDSWLKAQGIAQADEPKVI